MGALVAAVLVCARPAPINMVASSMGRPALAFAGTRSRSERVLYATIVVATGTMPDSAGDALPLFAKERPSAETVKEWVEKARPLLKPDETALIDGDEPRSLLVYKHSSLPAALIVEGATGGMVGISAANVATRDAQRQSILDANALKDDQSRSHRSEIEDGLFKRLQSALMPNAPLLLHGLENAHKQTHFPKRHEGSAAFLAIAKLGEISAMLPGEESTHDAELMRLVFRPLSPLHD